MKPPPVLDQPVEKSYSGANMHFNDLISRYGPIVSGHRPVKLTIYRQSSTCQNRLEKKVLLPMDIESWCRVWLGRTSRKQAGSAISELVYSYKDFDFHAKCHGMKWENIAELVDDLDLSGMGYLWTLQGDAIREQTGVFRTK